MASHHDGKSKSALHKLSGLVFLTTIMSPTRDGQHHVPAAGDGAGRADEKIPHTPFGALGDAIYEHLWRLYKELCGRSQTLTRSRFVRFLKESQGEKVVLPLEKERYKFGEFLEIWCFQYKWDALRPVAEQKDLSRSIANYFISSSHNTYLMGNQLSSDASADVYRNVSAPSATLGTTTFLTSVTGSEPGMPLYRDRRVESAAPQVWLENAEPVQVATRETAPRLPPETTVVHVHRDYGRGCHKPTRGGHSPSPPAPP